MGGLGKMGRMGKRKNADDGLACLSQIMKIIYCQTVSICSP
jgi:hypothetical protein